MKRNNAAKWLVIVLVCVLCLCAVPTPARGADASATVTLTQANAAAQDSGTVTATTVTSDGSYMLQWIEVYTPSTATVTVTNGEASAMLVTFGYEATGASFGGAAADRACGRWSGILAAGASVTVSAVSMQAKDATSTVRVFDCTMTPDAARSVTFKAPNKLRGSITAGAGGSAVTSNTAKTATYSEGIPVTATPKSGYQFLCWKDGSGRVLAETASAVIRPTENCTVEAEFISNGTTIPYWNVGGKIFSDLATALSAAQSGSAKQVVMVRGGTLTSGTYTVPSGVRVLIPYSSQWAFDETPVAVPYTSAEYAAPESPYAVLTMAQGAQITVAAGGALNVGSRMFSGCGGYTQCGAPTGTSARINMNAGSSITVYGKLYAYGFITGSGTVSAENGAEVHEFFQACEHRGGGAFVDLKDSVFPISQYYVQNIEAPITFKYGARELTSTNLYAKDQMNQCDTIPIISVGNSSGLYRLLDSGASLTRTYDPATDRINYDFNGNVALSSIALSVVGYELSTASLVLPINGNSTLHIQSGTTQIANSAELLPGAELTVDAGATLQINNDKLLYLFDRDEWVGRTYAFNGCDLVPVAYSPTRTYTRTSADLVDAKLDVNGTVTVKGLLLATASGADARTSQGTGRVVLADAVSFYVGDDTPIVQQVEGYETRRYVATDYVALRNVDAAGTVTAADGHATTPTRGYPVGTEFHWCADHGRWESGSVTVTFAANGGSGSASATVHTPGTLPAEASAVSRAGLHVSGWNTAADGSGDGYDDGGFMALKENTTLYAQWAGTVTWKDGDGNTLKTEEAAYGATPAYSGDAPTKTATAQYAYAFADGWSASAGGAALNAIPAMTGDATYHAVFTATVRQYTITWKNWDNSVLRTDSLDYGATPAYTDATPACPGDSTDDYSRGWIFTGWSPTIVPVSGDAVYSAQFTEDLKYKIRFYNYDGTTLLKTIGVSPGDVPAYTGADPTPPGSGYTFTGWATSVNGTALASLPACTGAASYYAAFERQGSGIEGDVNGDGCVDYVDLTKLLANYNKTGAGIEGDVNGDGCVDYVDLTKLLANYNKTA